jgi:hypothetical protein
MASGHYHECFVFPLQPGASALSEARRLASLTCNLDDLARLMPSARGFPPLLTPRHPSNVQQKDNYTNARQWNFQCSGIQNFSGYRKASFRFDKTALGACNFKVILVEGSLSTKTSVTPLTTAGKVARRKNPPPVHTEVESGQFLVLVAQDHALAITSLQLQQLHAEMKSGYVAPSGPPAVAVHADNPIGFGRVVDAVDGQASVIHWEANSIRGLFQAVATIDGASVSGCLPHGVSARSRVSAFGDVGQTKPFDCDVTVNQVFDLVHGFLEVGLQANLAVVNTNQGALLACACFQFSSGASPAFWLLSFLSI